MTCATTTFYRQTRYRHDDDNILGFSYKPSPNTSTLRIKELTFLVHTHRTSFCTFESVTNLEMAATRHNFEPGFLVQAWAETSLPA